jgi:lipoate-protein ligase A
VGRIQRIGQHTVKKKRRYPFGGVEVLLSVKGERICNLKITGDFFGFSDVAELESALCGARLSEVSSIISGFEVSNYLFGMTDKELAELILS